MNRLFSAFFAIAALTLPASSVAVSIEPGFDLLKTKKGELTLDRLKGVPLPSPVMIPLKGNPAKKPGFGNTDTIIQRKKVVPKDNTGKKSNINIELVSLSLRSVTPIKLDVKGKGKKKFDAFVTLDPKQRSQGKLKIKSHDDKKGSGGFTISLLDVFLQLDFIPIAGNRSGSISEKVEVPGGMTGNGTWSHEPTKFYPTIPNLPAGNLILNPFGITDGVFALTSLVAAQVPEPATLVLLGTGLLLIGIGRRRGLVR